MIVFDFQRPINRYNIGMGRQIKGHWQRKFLLAISILLDDLTMKILSFPSRTF